MIRLTLGTALTALLPLLVILASACSPASGLSGSRIGEAGTASAGAVHVHQNEARQVASTARTAQGPTLLTVNVTVDDTGIVPAVLSVPVGAPVRLVLRNRGAHEHHFHILGLSPVEMSWLAKDFESGSAVGMSEADHLAHHGGQMVPYHICTSRAGLCPTGLNLHAHAGSGEIDVIQFIATTAGTYQATCPLHPGMQSKVVVF